MPRTEKFSRLAVASLALNAVLVVFLLLGPQRDSTAENSRPVPSPVSDAPADRPAHRPMGDAGKRDWKASLQQSNVPRHVLIAAIQADFDAKWNERDAELQKRYTKGEIEIEDLALFNLDREVALEAALREALGEAAFREWDRNRKFFDINTGALALSDDEANRLHSIRTALTDRLRALERSKLKKEIDPATYEAQYENAQADYEQELTRLVGFRRFNEARDSGIPAYLRRELRGLGLTDAEFAQIREIEGKFGDGKAHLQAAAQHGSIDSIKLDHEQETLGQLRDAQLQQLLGEKAYALYRKRQDPRYQTMFEFAASWQLSEQDVDNVFQLLHAHETETRRVKLAAYAEQRPSEEIQQQVAGLEARLNESLLQRLPAHKVEQLRRNGIIR